MYAIVRSGGQQKKVAVGDVIEIDKVAHEVGESVTLPAVLVVDGDTVVSDPAELGGYQVAAEIVGDVKGPKINIIRYKNKTGYRRRLGHRQQYTQVKITGITKGGAASKSSASKSTAGKSSATKSPASKSSGTASKSRTASRTSKSAASTAASDKES